MMSDKQMDMIDDFLEGKYVKPFEDGETRVYEFNIDATDVVDKNDYSGNPVQVLRFEVRNVDSTISNWKIWDLSRVHGGIYKELMNGNGGKGWRVMEITRHGLQKNTRYIAKGVN